MLKKLIAYMIISIVCVLSVYSQAQITPELIDSVNIKYSNPNTPDTTELKPIIITKFKYKFIPKDTLIYTSTSKDSIVINYGTPLLKERMEVHQIICDSINSIGNYCLQIKLINFEANERESLGEPVKHYDSPWLGRTVFLEIDSVGFRYNATYDDTNKVGLAPGGAFMHTLLFPFKYSEFNVNSSWMLEDIDYLVENGLPCPAIRSNYLYSNQGTIDTLNENCNRLEFIKTSQGSITLPPEKGQKEGLRITSVIASGGVLDISNSRNIPIHIMQTMEQKLSIHKSKDDIIPGKHYITTFSTLTSYNKFLDKNIKKNNKIKKTKKNKNK